MAGSRSGAQMRRTEERGALEERGKEVDTEECLKESFSSCGRPALRAGCSAVDRTRMCAAGRDPLRPQSPASIGTRLCTAGTRPLSLSPIPSTQASGLSTCGRARLGLVWSLFYHPGSARCIGGCADLAAYTVLATESGLESAGSGDTVGADHSLSMLRCGPAYQRLRGTVSCAQSTPHWRLGST